jgi:tetrapyrrole methylase family protein/MazG family protein
MPTLTLLGLGPGDLDNLTLAAWRVLTGARCLILRTERHPCVATLRNHLPPDCTILSCDDLYEQHAEFADVYAALVARVLEAATAGDVVYAVPGHPWVGEATTPPLAAQAAARGVAVQTVDGLSFVAPAFAAVGVDLMDGAQVLDAMLLARQHYPQIDPCLPLLLAQVFARWLASDVKLTLLAAYPAEHPVTLIYAAGTAQQRTVTLPLAELDRHDDFDHLTSLFAPPLPQYSSFSALLELVAHLRAPEGCPWDREQTLETLRKDLLGEAAEVLEAIDLEADGRDNSRHIAEELGDLALVVAMMAQIAQEEGRFQMGDIMREVVTKLIRRHPHVFAEVQVSGVDHVLANWDAIKAQEKAAAGVQPHPLDGIPAALPALEKARKLQSKAARLGLFDRSAAAYAHPPLADLLAAQPDADRLGALLWQLVALAREHDLDAEDALRQYAVLQREVLGGA